MAWGFNWDHLKKQLAVSCVEYSGRVRDGKNPPYLTEWCYKFFSIR